MEPEVNHQANIEPVVSFIPYRCFQSKRELLFHVGIRYEFLSELQEMEDWVWLHREDVDQLKKILKKNLTEMEENHKNMDILEDVLYGLGFTRDRAKVLRKWITDDAYSSHQTVFYFANIYLENILTPKLLPLCNKTRPLFHPPASDSNTVVLFHSTTRTHARQISDIGIRANMGKPCQDFSDQGGFYLTDNLEYAIRWAELRSFATDPAILVYTLPRKLISLFKGLHLDRVCLTDMSLWKKIIQYNHNGRREHCDKMDYLYNAKSTDDKVNYQKHVDYILGPVSLYGGVSMFSNVIQMCILTQHMADALSVDNNKYLHQMYQWGGFD